MSSGLPNKEKATVREQLRRRGWWAARRCWQRREPGLPRRRAPAPSTGTANSNQMLLEAMGLHVPGAAFVQPACTACARR
jgi:phosphogluconate dehydratase